MRMRATRRPLQLLLLWSRAVRAIERRSPIMLRRQHQAEMIALGRAAESLCEAVRRASAASLLATRQWQNAALRYRRERDEALVEIERLRATVASLVVGANGT
jgi:hypothetical protein